MPAKILLIAIIFLQSIYQCCLYAQEKNYSFFNYTKPYYDIPNTVNCIEFFNNEFLIGNQTGIKTFDGTTFKDFKGVSGLEVYDILVEDSIMWICSNKGLYTFNSDTITKVFNDISKPVYNIQVFMSKKIFLFNDTLYQIETNKNPVKLLRSNSFALEPPNIIWNAFEKELTKIELNGIDSLDMLESKYFNSKIDLLYLSNKNGLFIMADRTLYYRFNGEDKYRIKHLPSNSRANCINEVSNNEIWIGTESNGIYSFNTAENKLFNISATSKNIFGLRSNDINDIYIDLEDNIWVGTQTGGLSKYIKPRINHDLLNENDSCNYYWDIVGKNDSVLYLGGSNGWLLEYYPDKRSFCRIITLNEPIRAILPLKCNKTVLGSDGKGCFILDSLNNVFKIKEVDVMLIRSLTSVNNNLILIGTSKGVYLYDIYKDKVINHFLKGKFIYTVVSDPKDKNIFWVGGYGNGFYKLDINTGEAKSFGYDNTILSFLCDCDDDSVMWIGTAGNGLLKFNTYSNSVVNSYKKEYGFLDNVVLNIIEGEENTLILTTNKGLTIFDKELNRVISTYDYFDGLISDEFVSGAAFSKGDDLYFGTTEGVALFNKKELSKSTREYYSVDVTSIQLEKNNILISDFENKELPYKSNCIIEYRSTNLSDAHDLFYYWELQNIDTKEKIVDTDNQINLRELGAGKYKLSLSASNIQSNYIDDQITGVKEIYFYIVKPLYKRNTLYIILVILIAVSFVLSIRQYYKNLIRLREKEESNISKYYGEFQNQAIEIIRLDNVKDIIDRICMSINLYPDFKNSRFLKIDYLKRVVSYYNGGEEEQERNYEVFIDDNNSFIVKRKGNTFQYNEPLYVDVEDLYIFPIIFRNNIQRNIHNQFIYLGFIEVYCNSNISANENIKFIIKTFLTIISNKLYNAIYDASLKNIQTRLTSISYNSSNPKDYLNNVLIFCNKLLNGTKADLSLLNFKGDLHIPEIICKNNYTIEEEEVLTNRFKDSSNKNGIIPYVISIGRYYYTGNVKKDRLYFEEFESIKSELVVPLIYKSSTIGVINIYSNCSNFFDDYKAEFLQIIANITAQEYQLKKISNVFRENIVPYLSFLKKDELFDSVKKSIEAYFGTDTVRIFTKHIEHKDNEIFVQEDSLSYKQSFTKTGFEVLKKSKEKSNEIQIIQLENENGDNKHCYAFAKKHSFKSLLLVPIWNANEIYWIIYIFSNRKVDKIFPEDHFFLSQISNKIALSNQISNLLDSFFKISEYLFKNNLKETIDLIVTKAREVLKADIVVIYLFNSNATAFEEVSIDGELIDSRILKVIDKPENISSHLAKIVLDWGEPVWIASKKQYSKFIDSRLIKSKYFNNDFWTREKINALAALPLGYINDAEGVIFVNYREKISFSNDIKHIIELFASQASIAIMNSKERQGDNSAFRENQNLSKSLIESTIVTSLGHNSGNIVSSLSLRFSRLKDKLSKSKNASFSSSEILESLKVLEDPLSELKTDFDRLKEYRKPSQEEIRQIVELKTLIKDTIELIKYRIRKSNITVKEIYYNKPIQVKCDVNQIKHVLLNIILNAVEAIDSTKGGGDIRIKTSVESVFVVIDILDNGPGIKDEVKKRIFEPYYTKNKKNGTGLGLPISRYIIQELHGGSIELPPCNKGANFVIKIPNEL